jgi:hypothetical protein
MTRWKMFAALALLGGCQIVSGPPGQTRQQDMEFLRGCWVAKDAPGGKVLAFLRLLPESVNGSAYQGHVQQVGNGHVANSTFFSFARDGSQAITETDGVRTEYFGDPPDTPVLEDGTRRAMFVGLDEGLGFLIAYGREDRLTIAVRNSGSQRITFEGKRDGCD